MHIYFIVERTLGYSHIEILMKIECTCKNELFDSRRGYVMIGLGRIFIILWNGMLHILKNIVGFGYTGFVLVRTERKDGEYCRQILWSKYIN